MKLYRLAREIIALVLQSLGGGVPSPAEYEKSRTDQGIKTMIAGRA